VTCPTCQAENPAGARFCNNCGNPLGAPRSLDGERRLVTILFADVVGSTSLAERVDPEEWTEIMNGAMRFMIQAVTRYEGTVARLMGDGLLALFGAPVSHEDDAERAVLAALAIRDAAADYSAHLRRRYGFEFAVRSGVNTGLSVLTHVGDETKAEYTAMGDSANLAARLQALAPPQGVLIGPDTHALVRHAFVTRMRGEEAIKGKSEAVATFEVSAALPGVVKARGLEGGESPFLGRGSELAALRAAVERASGGRASVVFLVGEAGLGKSRLLEELRRGLDPSVDWVEGRAISYARTAAYHPWRHLLVKSLGLSEGAAGDEIEQRLGDLHLTSSPGGGGSETASVTDPPAGAGSRSPGIEPPTRPSWLDVLSLLAGAGAPADHSAPLGSGVEDAAKGITAALTLHLKRLTSERPLVAVLEDLHWADQASVRLVESLANALDGERILLVCSMRPDSHSPAYSLLERVEAGDLDGASAQVGVVEVNALTGGDAEALLDDLLTIEGMPQATRATILEKAEGNPFYLEEVIRSLIGSGHVVKDGDRWVARRAITEVSVPDTLVGVLSARIDRLPENARQVAQTASVIGREFASRVLGAVMRDTTSDTGPPDLQPQLRTLIHEDLVNQTYLQRDIDYRFKHELTKDAAYERLLLKRRRDLHGRVGDELVALYGDREAEIAEDLAHHYLLGERWLEAAHWSLAAARSARQLYSLPEAEELTETALTAIERVLDAHSTATQDPSVAAAGTQVEALELQVKIVTEQVNLAIMMRVHEDPARRPQLLERARRAIELAKALDDKRLVVTSLVNYGNIHVLSGFPITGFESLLQAHDLAMELGDDKLFLLPFWVATEILLDDAPARAAEQFDKVIELARKVGNKDIEAHALGTKVAALARLGDFEAARELSQVALAAAEASGSVIKRADVGMLVGSAFVEMGQFAAGLEHIERGTDLALSVNGIECACSGLHLLGLGQMADNHLTEAVGNLRRSLEYATSTGFANVVQSVRASLASARFLTGEIEAIEAIEQEIDNAEALNDGYGASRSRLALAQALSSIGKSRRGESHARRAVEWFEARGMQPYALRGLNLLAALLAEQGDERASEAVRRRAQELKVSIKWPPNTPVSATLEPEDGAHEAPLPGGD